MQRPIVHVVPLLHTVPHAPQLRAFEARLTQAPPQLVSIAPHVVPQRPPEHICPLVHAVPHAPQFMGLELMSTQTPPQSRWPAGQLQWPAAHVCEPVHAVPHAPQFA